MILRLIMMMIDELKSRRNPEIRWKEIRTQFYVHKIQIVNLPRIQFM